jgi:hypothetical protein
MLESYGVSKKLDAVVVFFSVTDNDDRSRMDRADNEALISSVKKMLLVDDEPRWYCH